MQRNEKKLYIYIFLAKDIFPLEYLLDSYLQAIIFQSLSRREKRSTIVESKLYIPEEWNLLPETVQIFVSFLPRAEVQSRFPAESTEIIKSISGLETRQLEEWFYRRMTKFFILLFLSSLSLSFFFLIFRGKSRRYPGEFLFRVSKTWLRLPAN